MEKYSLRNGSRTIFSLFSFIFKSCARFFYYEFVNLFEGDRRMFSSFFLLSPLFLVKPEEKWPAKSFLCGNKSPSEFQSFFEKEKASRRLICRGSVNNDGGGPLSETWRGFLIILKVFRKVSTSPSFLSFHPNKEIPESMPRRFASTKGRCVDTFPTGALLLGRSWKDYVIGKRVIN